jgi:hypothetical protein
MGNMAFFYFAFFATCALLGAWASGGQVLPTHFMEFKDIT